MKLQYLAVIFIIIILPIALVLSFYMQAQIDTLNLQTSYTAKLNDATHDAVKAFQLNTTNSYYSSVSDSKIRDIEASVNTFYNSLTASLHFTKSELQAFVPAMVYTLYDGYYIYGKRYNVYENVKKNSNDEIISMNIITNTDEETNPDKYEYGLKPFVYYSCRYKTNDGNYDFVVNFTLDNFISIYGTVYEWNDAHTTRTKKYVTKSGYLIKLNDCGNATLNSSGYASDIGKYKGAEIQTNESLKEYIRIKSTSGGNINLSDGEYQYVVYKNQKIYISGSNYFWYTDGTAQIVNSQEIKSAVGNAITNSAREYYTEAYNFSKWVSDNIGNIMQKDVSLSSGELKFNSGSNRIFDMENQDPEDASSIFNQHRIAVIRNTIETNLIAAINSYNTNASSYAYALPELNEEEWEKVVNNVCVVSFLQGLPLGGKYYNNYVVIPNDINNEFVDIDAVYMLTNDGQYHMPNCPKLVEDKNYQNSIENGYVNTTFERQTFDEDYYYHHVKNGNISQPYTPCYHCIVNASAKYDMEDIMNSSSNTIRGYDNNKNEKMYDIATLRRKYLTILSREKYNLYKTNN